MYSVCVPSRKRLGACASSHARVSVLVNGKRVGVLVEVKREGVLGHDASQGAISLSLYPNTSRAYRKIFRHRRHTGPNQGPREHRGWGNLKTRNTWAYGLHMETLLEVSTRWEVSSHELSTRLEASMCGAPWPEASPSVLPSAPSPVRPCPSTASPPTVHRERVGGGGGEGGRGGVIEGEREYEQQYWITAHPPLTRHVCVCVHVCACMCNSVCLRVRVHVCV